MGGDLNFDYRYAWLRDLSLTIRSLWIAACPDEPHRLFDWFANAAGTVGPELIQIMYGVEGERDLAEHTLDHLAGYRDSRPVRIGNDAWAQVQLDVLGEVLDAAHVLRDQLGDLDDHVGDMLVTLADRAADGGPSPTPGCGRPATTNASTCRRRSCAGSPSTGPSASRPASVLEPTSTAGQRPETRSAPPCSSRGGAAEPAHPLLLVRCNEATPHRTAGGERIRLSEPIAPGASAP